METKPFHESLVTSLEAVKKRLLAKFTDENGKIDDMFIFRFRLELLPLTELLCATTIPGQFIPQMKREIGEFCVNFVTDYIDIGPTKEMDRVENYFNMMLTNLKGR